MVYFIGAGPGDPELLTIKAKKIIDSADLIIYAGSLVNPEVLSGAKKSAKIYNSAKLCLDEVIGLMKEAESESLITARVHTGDPSLYGAHREQMRELDKLGIAYEVIPGVSSFLAAAASLNIEYTLPEVTQTVILTRMEGRTPVPHREKIEELAKHNCAMVIFLSINMIEKLAEKLLLSYKEETPAAVVYKASWEDEKIIRGNLSNIAKKVREANIRKTALVIVGEELGENFSYSRLYDKRFGHEFRAAADEEER